MTKSDRGRNRIVVITSIVVLGILVVVMLAVGVPLYGVYLKEQYGRSLLAEAESTRQVRVLEAKAKAESAKLEAEAEVIRAEGAAKAIAELSSQLKENPEYLRYLYITGLQEQKGNERTVVYIPTDGFQPTWLLESGRVPNLKSRPQAPATEN